MNTHNDEHRYKIAFDIIKHICKPRIESGKNYTQISTQEVISYIAYECDRLTHERNKNTLPYSLVEELRTKRARDELTKEEMKDKAKEYKVSIKYIREATYWSFNPETSL